MHRVWNVYVVTANVLVALHELFLYICDLEFISTYLPRTDTRDSPEWNHMSP